MMSVLNYHSWFYLLSVICISPKKTLIPPPHWLTNQRAGGCFWKVSCAQVHVSRLPVHTLVVALHLFRRCDHDGEHRAAAGPGKCRFWCYFGDPERELNPVVNACPALPFSMNISSSRRRVIKTEGAEPPWRPGPGTTAQTGFLLTEEELMNRRFYQFFETGLRAELPRRIRSTWQRQNSYQLVASFHHSPV